MGEVVDLILLRVGVLTLGLSAFSGARLLLDFGKTAVNAQSDHDLDTAGRLFAQAVTILGISVIQAVLLHGQARTVIARGQPRIYPRVQVGPPPAAGEVWLSRPSAIPSGDLGTTDAYGAIQISRDQPLSEQQITLYHELVHRYFSPRTGPFRQFRAEVNMSAYSRSVLLRYLEEALAEGYAQLRVNGLAAGLRAYRFPLDGGYVTVSQVATEGAGIGTIVLGGTLFQVTISQGPMPGTQ